MFGEAEETIRVFESDGIVADAAAGADYIKIRSDAMFNSRDVRALEVHEGLVHVGTTLNGLNQPICTFLAKGPPSSTVTQEGLAILMEVIAFASLPQPPAQAHQPHPRHPHGRGGGGLHAGVRVLPCPGV